MGVYLCNTFTLHMLAQPTSVLEITKISKDDIPDRIYSAVRSRRLAAVISNVLERDIKYNREDVFLESGDVLFLAQYMEPPFRTGHGVILPSGDQLAFYKIVVV